MVFAELFQKSQIVIAENSAAILTATGVVGTVTTAVLTGRASIKAHRVIEDAAMQDISAGPLETKEKFKLAWPFYVPAVASGITTVTAIVFAHRINTSKSAAMAAAYSISEKGFQEYKQKIVDKLGDKKEQDVKDSIAQDQVNASPLDQSIIIAGSGEVLCFDSYSGRYFNSTMETIKQAENKVNYEIIHHQGCSMSEFYDLLSLPVTDYSDQLGWTISSPLRVTYSTTMSADQRPCIVIQFDNAPVTNFAHVY